METLDDFPTFDPDDFAGPEETDEDDTSTIVARAALERHRASHPCACGNTLGALRGGVCALCLGGSTS